MRTIAKATVIRSIDPISVETFCGALHGHAYSQEKFEYQSCIDYIQNHSCTVAARLLEAVSLPTSRRAAREWQHATCATSLAISVATTKLIRLPAAHANPQLNLNLTSDVGVS